MAPLACAAYLCLPAACGISTFLALLYTHSIGCRTSLDHWYSAAAPCPAGDAPRYGLTATRPQECLTLAGAALPETLLARALPALKRLRALDLSASSATDAAAAAMASLPCLTALALNNTACGDKTIAALTYGLQLRGWVSAWDGSSLQMGVGRDLRGSAELDATLAAWPPLELLSELRMRGTPVTDAAVQGLELLPLQHLDLSHTAVSQRVLGPLCARVGLRPLRPEDRRILSCSASVALAAAGASPCCCGVPELAPSSRVSGLRKWSEEGAAWLAQAEEAAAAAAAAPQPRLPVHQPPSCAAGEGGGGGGAPLRQQEGQQASDSKRRKR